MGPNFVGHPKLISTVFYFATNIPQLINIQRVTLAINPFYIINFWFWSCQLYWFDEISFLISDLSLEINLAKFNVNGKNWQKNKLYNKPCYLHSNRWKRLNSTIDWTYNLLLFRVRWSSDGHPMQYNIPLKHLYTLVTSLLIWI